MLYDRWMRGTPQGPTPLIFVGLRHLLFGLRPLILWIFPVYFEDLRLINKNCVLSPARLGDRVLHIGKLILPIERKFKNIKKIEK